MTSGGDTRPQCIVNPGSPQSCLDYTVPLNAIDEGVALQMAQELAGKANSGMIPRTVTCGEEWQVVTRWDWWFHVRDTGEHTNLWCYQVIKALSGSLQQPTVVAPPT